MIDGAGGDRMRPDREAGALQLVRGLDVDPHIGQIAVDVEIDPHRHPRADDTDADRRVFHLHLHRYAARPRAARHRRLPGDPLARLETGHRAHQFAPVTASAMTYTCAANGANVSLNERPAVTSARSSA